MDFVDIRERYYELEKDVKKQLEEREYIDHEYFSAEIKNIISMLKEELKKYMKEQEAALEERVMLPREHREFLAVLQGAYKEVYAIITSGSADKLVRDNFYNEISEGIPEERKNKIIKLINELNVIEYSTYGEAEYIFNRINEIVEDEVKASK
jgi:uncharacterized protein YjcR